MKRLMCIGSAVLCISTALLHAQGANKPAAKAIAPPLTYTGIYKELMGLEADQTKVASIAGVNFQRDVAEFFLEQGQLYLCKPVGGRICAAVFIGSGTFTFTPPTDVEKKQLA